MATFEQALRKSALPRRLGDVELKYETTMWVGRADRPPRTALANLGLVAGASFAVAALGAILTRADQLTVGLFLLPCAVGFGAAAFLEQRDRRQRAFSADFHGHVLRLDFSTRLSGMPRTLHIPFEEVRDLELADQGGQLRVLTVDFEVGEQLFREVLIADVTVKQLPDAERVRRMLRAAVGLEKPKEEEKPDPGPQGPPPVVDSFG